MVEAIFYKWDYCLSFKEIPNEEFEAKHRSHYAYEFSLLELQNNYQDSNELQYGKGEEALNFSHTRQMDGISSDEDDIFNDKVTDKIDEINAIQKNKHSALDKLTSPDNLLLSSGSKLEAQHTGST